MLNRKIRKRKQVLPRKWIIDKLQDERIALRERAGIALQYLTWARIGEIYRKTQIIEKKELLNYDGTIRQHASHRKGETFPGMRWMDIRLDTAEKGYIEILTRTEKSPIPNRTIIIPLKGGKRPPSWTNDEWNETVMLEELCLEIVLNDWFDHQKEKGLTRPTDEIIPIGACRASHALAPVLGIYNGEKITPHHLRTARINHSVGRLPSERIKNQAGHVKQDTTDWYLQTKKDDVIRDYIG